MTDASYVQDLGYGKVGHDRGDKSCGIFSRRSIVRRAASVVAHSWHFSRIMLVVIALNAAFLAMWDPVANLYQLSSVRNNIVKSSELFFQTSYSVEMLVIMVADGLFWESKEAYFRTAWHWFDFLVVLLGWIALGFEYTSSTGASPLLRVIRVLRPLRGLQYVPGLSVLNNTIVRSLEQLGDVLLFLLFTYFVLSVVGLTVFEGRLHQRCGWQSSTDDQWYLYPPLADRFCSLSAIGGLRCPVVNFTEPGTGLGRPVVCAAEFDPPNTGLTGFDNIFQSMITVFVMVTMEGWTGVMYWYNDATNEWSQLYFLVVMLFGSFIILSLITAVLTINYTAEREKVQMKRSMELKKRQIADMARIAEQRHKAMQRARRALVSDIELRLIYSYEKFRQTPGYSTVTPAMYNRYVAKHSVEEMQEFSGKVAQAMLRRRKILHPEGELHLFSSVAPPLGATADAMESVGGTESSLGETGVVYDGGSEGDVPEFVNPDTQAGSDFPLSRPKLYPFEDQYGVPWGEDSKSNTIIQVSYAVVMSRAFQSFIWFCITLNTVLLGYDHFLQPPQSIVVSDSLNKALTAIYTVEAVLKLFGFGPKYYFADKFNIFDLFVVTVSWVEIIVNLAVIREGGRSSAATSAFRVFRLLRVLRLAQMWGSLKTLLRTIIRTFRGVYPFTVLLAVFLYIYTVSGLLIFGGTLQIPPTITDPITQDTSPNPDFDCTNLYGNFYLGNISHCPQRVNYDTLLWSFVTSFQILTKENWDALMYAAADAANSWVPALYFLTVVLTGPFIVLNLFLAILIDSFMEVHEDERSIRKEQTEKKLKLKEERARHRKKRKSERTLTDTVVDQPENGTAKPRLKRSESMTSMTTAGVSSPGGSEDADLQTWVKTRLVTLEKEKESGPLLECPAFKGPSLCFVPATNPMRVLFAVIVESAAFQVFSFFVIILACIELILDVPAAPGDPVDLNVANALSYVNIFCVSVFVLEMALKVIAYGFVLNAGAYLRDPWNVMDFVVVVFSIADLILVNQPGLNVVKAIRALRPLRLIRHIEGMRVVVASVVHAVIPVSQIALVALMFYFIFAVVATTLFGGRTEGCYVCDPALTVCERGGVNTTTGAPLLTRTCFPYRTYGVSNCPPILQCVGGQTVVSAGASGAGGTLSWRNPQYELSGAQFSFDNVLVSILVLYEVSTLELWLETMYSATDITGVGHTPIRGASDAYSLFFVVFIFFVNFFLLQLFVASVVDSFSETDMRYSGKAFMTETQFEWIQMQHKVHRMTFARRLVPPARKWRRHVFNLVTSPAFDSAMLSIILINTILLASDHYDMTPSYRNFLDVADYVFGSIYIGEMSLKIVGLGRQYFRHNSFDFCIVITIILTWILQNTDAGDFFNVFEIFRVLRVGRLARRHQGMSNLIATLAFSIPALINISMLVLLIFFVYTIFGIQLFGSIPSSPAVAARMNFLNDYANFRDFVSAFITLFRMATGESWNGIMRDLALESAAAWPYCVSFVLTVQFVFLNLFVAIVLGNFSAVLTKSKKEVISDKTLDEFARIWQMQVDHFDAFVRKQLVATLKSGDDDEETGVSVVTGTSSKQKAPDQLRTTDERCYRLALAVMDPTYLPATTFPDIFVSLKPPLGLPLSKSLSPSDLMRFMRMANIPVTKTGMINARATLAALVDHALGADSGDESYALLHSALKIRMVSDVKSTAEHAKAMTEKATTHSVAEEIATRRLQATARYLLARRRVEKQIEDGTLTAEQGADTVQQLSLQYNREIVAGRLHVDLFASNKTSE